jgi:hypothetical protein
LVIIPPASSNSDRAILQHFDDLVQFIGQLSRQPIAKRVGETAIVPERFLARLAKTRPNAFADIWLSKIAKNRPGIVNLIGAKVEAEEAQIVADAKAKVRAQIEADLRAKAVADATAKAEAEAKADIEAASKAKDDAAAAAKAKEDARLEAVAVARQQDQVRKDKEAADAKVRADARAKEQAIADQAEVARQAREADEKARAAEAQAAADKAAEEARIAAQEQAAHEANLKKVANAGDAAIVNKKAEKAAWMATAVKAESYQLAMSCNMLTDGGLVSPSTTLTE